ncbi:MAG: hypothetical protein GX591_03170, partial [Planctomycetes bacterium]|nr:hypothetical protein [Planctomycetota bacterium]
MKRSVIGCACVLLALAAAAGAATTTQISQFGITWTFAQPVECGQFANGDWWVVGPVDIVAIDPASFDAGGYVINGSMINPVPESQQQGFDSRVGVTYVPALNVAYGVSPASPLTVPPHASLLSSISLGEPEGSVTIDTVAILTVLPEAAPAGSFRPAYCTADKTIRYNVSQLDYGLLRKLAPAGSPPSLATVERMFERPWIEYVADHPSRAIHPRQNMPDYGREISSNVSQAALSLHLDYTDAQKATLLVRFVQVGIDFYGIVQAGGDDVWVANGGHMHGRKWPILFAGLMLGDADMQHVQATFQEDQQTYYGAGWSGAKALWRITPGTAYLQDEVHPSDWLVDGRGEPGDPPAGSNSHARSEAYRHCCTSYTWVGQALAAYLMGAEGLWDHSPYFGYVQRWMTQDWTAYDAIIQQETGRTYGNQLSANPGWTGDMWHAYRALGGPVPPTADAGEDLSVRDNDDDGAEPVTLDGSGSVALGSIVGYAWSEGGVPLGSGAAPTVPLAVGEHTIDLTVTDDNGATDSDSVTVIVEPAPAGGGAVIFDLSAAYNYDAVSTQSEADHRNAGQNICESYGDHQPWTSNRDFCATEL